MLSSPAASSPDPVTVEQFNNLPVARDRDIFLRELLSQLAETLEQVVGTEQAEGFISIVGNRIGQMMQDEYTVALGVDKLSLQQTAQSLVDLKRRIEGGFSIESIDATRIVLVNTACPFGDYVKGHSSLCMMTSNVFGRITANNLGYAHITLDKTIAKGDAGCRVVIELDPAKADEVGNGRDYFNIED